MNYDDLYQLYTKLKLKYGENAYLHISEMLEEARAIHKADYLKSAKAKKLIAQGKEPDAEQSWKSFKGKNLQRLLTDVLQDYLAPLGFKITSDDNLERANLDAESSAVMRNVLVRFGGYGVVPDADLIIYEEKTRKVVAIVSAKVTLRERVAQTAYWGLKLKADPHTKGIRTWFVTLDEDGTLVRRLPNVTEAEGITRLRGRKGRVIVEHDLDCTYVLREVEESHRVKLFPRLIEDLKKLKAKSG